MQEVLIKIEQYPIIPVFYADDLSTCISVLKECYAGGARVFEFVNRGENALANFKAMLNYQRQHLTDMSLGIGTIKTAAEAISFLEIGAAFIVSPIVNLAIAEETLSKGILWIPGCMTPTEIFHAEKIGAPIVKLFPGDLLGPGFLKSVKPLFPTMKFMITGGVSLVQSSMQDWFENGATALGLGSNLFKPHESSLEDRLKEIFEQVNRL